MGARETLAYVEPFHLTVLARTYLALRDFARARALLDQALVTARGRPTIEVTALLAHAQLLRATDGLRASDQIEASLRNATALIEAMDARGLAPFVHIERAQLARLRQDDAAWRCELEVAHQQFNAIGATGQAEWTAKELSARPT